MVLSKKANNKGADQTAQMRSLVCAVLFAPPPSKTGFLASRPKSEIHRKKKCNPAGRPMIEGVSVEVLAFCFYFSINSAKQGIWDLVTIYCAQELSK